MNTWNKFSKEIAEIEASYNVEYCGQVLTLEDQMDMAVAYDDESDVARVLRLMKECDMRVEALFA